VPSAQRQTREGRALRVSKAINTNEILLVRDVLVAKSIFFFRIFHSEGVAT
jgi:hypothetical protein